jgi:hypothetical protein
LNDEVVQLMPKYKILNDACTRIRNERFIDKNQCDDIPLFLKKDYQNGLFLRYDKGVNSRNRFIFFCYNLNYLKSSKTVLVDGTFWSVPNKFSQLAPLNVVFLENIFHYFNFIFEYT